MKQIKTGVPGLDELVEGGFPESSSIMVGGSAGVGKSILCLEYLYYGAKLYEEPSVYVTLEEGPHNLWWNMQRFKWDFLSLEKQGLMKIYKFEPTPEIRGNIEEQVAKIVEKAKENNANARATYLNAVFLFFNQHNFLRVASKGQNHFPAFDKRVH